MTAPTETGGQAPFADPVFVLCNGRSGSTLLRFLLDAHPQLACPPETNLPMLCVQLARVWSLIEGAPLSANRGDEPPEIPDAAIAGVRETMDRMVGSYLARRGKKRYCDKSLGTAQFAELLSRVYPEARFICLYRHPMDVIASGMEACPWGLNGYGFEPYVAAAPGNSVMALANFWADNVQATLMAQERLAGRSFRLRYEDLVADPEETAAELFEFLGVPAAPGISDRCFSVERERFGPADYKIWYTSKISSESVGRGWSVPAGMIAPQLLAVINELAGKLGYLPVDGQWGATEPPADLRVPIAAPPASAGNGAAGLGSAGNGPVILLSYGYSQAEHVQDALAAGTTPACTSGTGIVPLCMAAAETWRRIEGSSGQAGQAGQAGQMMSRLAASSIRGLVTVQLTAILAGAGRTRWCELATAPPGAAEAFLQVFPHTAFVCVHRSCLDVVREGAQASPWGLHGQGFAPYLLPDPGNTVAALAAYWAHSTEQLLAFEAANPESTHRIRYEDVDDHPGGALAVLRTSLGLATAADRAAPEPPGPSTAASPAAEARVPVELIPGPVRALIAGLHTELGYPPLQGASPGLRVSPG